jgi:hypothetical protein
MKVPETVKLLGIDNKTSIVGIFVIQGDDG